MLNKRFAIIDDEGIVDESNEDDILEIWGNDKELLERQLKGRVLLVEIIDEK